MYTSGYGALRRYRYSQSGASYFVTICTIRPFQNLDQPAIADAIIRETMAMERDATVRLRAAVLMPDHLHLVLQLGERLSIGRTVARLKSKTRLELSRVGGSWQGNFFEHRLRPDDSVRDVIHYLFMNPYRANLVSPGSRWPWFWLGEEESRWFVATTDGDRPWPAWLEV